MSGPSPNLDRRRRKADALAKRLGAMSDEALAALVAPGAAQWRVSWGASGAIEVDGQAVFVKKISLSDLERRPENHRSTANLFDLPLFYQYGVGSAGFGAWRELGALTTASEWALSGACEHFPLVYHWRVLPRSAPALTPAWRHSVQDMVAYWNGSDAVRARLEGMFNATAAVVVFLEHAPHDLAGWLSRKLTGGRFAGGVEADIHRAIGQIRDATAFMNERGMLHFDLHAYNLLSDGEQVLVGDFGLALSDQFDLSREERNFFETHRQYDRAYVDWAIAQWLSLRPFPPFAWLAELPNWPVRPPALQAETDYRRPVADIIGAFFAKLRENKTTPYPAAELAAAIAAQARTD